MAKIKRKLHIQFRSIRNRMIFSFLLVFLAVLVFMGASIYLFTVNMLETRNQQSYEKILEYARYLKEREELGTASGQMTLDTLTSYSNEKGEQLEKEIEGIINRIVESKDKERIHIFRLSDFERPLRQLTCILNRHAVASVDVERHFFGRLAEMGNLGAAMILRHKERPLRFSMLRSRSRRLGWLRAFSKNSDDRRT